MRAHQIGNPRRLSGRGGTKTGGEKKFLFHVSYQIKCQCKYFYGGRERGTENNIPRGKRKGTKKRKPAKLKK